MKFLFIINPISGTLNRLHSIVNLIDSIFRHSEHEYEFAYTTGPGDATNLTQQAASEGFDSFVAAGGDGTVNEVASALIHTSGRLGIIPLGSGNGIARSMNIPLKTSESIRMLLNPDIKVIDVGKVNQGYFIGVCGIGYDARIGMKFQEFGARGPMPYFLIGMREFLIYKPEELIVRFEREELNLRALVVAIANTKQYGNGAIIAPRANPQDGLLDLCILKAVSFSKAVHLCYKLFKGTIDQSTEYRHYRLNQLQIEFENDSIIHTDGEPQHCGNKLNIQLIRQALKIYVPDGQKYNHS